MLRSAQDGGPTKHGDRRSIPRHAQSLVSRPWFSSRRRQKARQTIRDTLAVNQKSWNDLLATLQFRGQHSDKLKKLFAMHGQDNDGEFDNARQKISDLLARERRSWNFFVDSLFFASATTWSDWHDPAASDPAIKPLDLVHHLLWRYLEMTPHQFVAVSLWIARTFVYRRFTVTPRLTVTSPRDPCVGA